MSDWDTTWCKCGHEKRLHEREPGISECGACDCEAFEEREQQG